MGPLFPTAPLLCLQRVCARCLRFRSQSLTKCALEQQYPCVVFPVETPPTRLPARALPLFQMVRKKSPGGRLGGLPAKFSQPLDMQVVLKTLPVKLQFPQTKTRAWWCKCLAQKGSQPIFPQMRRLCHSFHQGKRPEIPRGERYLRRVTTKRSEISIVLFTPPWFSRLLASLLPTTFDRRPRRLDSGPLFCT